MNAKSAENLSTSSSLLVIPPEASTFKRDGSSVPLPKLENLTSHQHYDTSHRGVPLPDINTMQSFASKQDKSVSCSGSLLIIPPDSDNTATESSSFAGKSYTGVPIPPDLLIQLSNLSQQPNETHNAKIKAYGGTSLVSPPLVPVDHVGKGNMDASYPDMNNSTMITDDIDFSIQHSGPILQQDYAPHQNPITFDSSIDRVEAAFEEMVDCQPRERSGRPLVVLDGANIGWHHGRHEYFSAVGLVKAIRALQTQYSVDLVAFIPTSYFRQNRYKQMKKLPINPLTQLNDHVNGIVTDTHDKSSNNDSQKNDNYDESIDEYELLQQLFVEGILIPVPPGDHDDAYILHYARSHHGFIVSNDFYRDYIDSMEVKSIQWSMQLWLQENRCSYAFVGDEMVLNPNSTFFLTLIHYQFVQLQQGQREPSLNRMDIEENYLTSLSSLAWMHKSDASFDDSSDYACANQSQEMQDLSKMLQSLTAIARKCFLQHRPLELRHMLFSRINILLQLSRIEEAERDFIFVRNYLAQPQEHGYAIIAEVAYYERLIHDYKHCMEIDDDLL